MLIPIFFSGCFEESKSLNILTNSYDNDYPVAVILAPNKAYFGDSIEFDATNSYDSDGKIVFYSWVFGDGYTGEGEKVKHLYKFEDDLNIEYPLIYTITLLIMDNDGAGIATSHEIKVYPRTYVFYLLSGRLEIEKPSSDKDKIKASFGILNLNPLQELTYELQNPINISPCFWNVTLYLKKPYLTRLSKIKLKLYDSNNNEISKTEKNFGIFRLWNKKTIKLEGKLDKKAEFQSVTLSIYGFSLGTKISILYGNDKASQICFTFRN